MRGIMHLDLSYLPTDAGVYLFKDADGKILYIGKAKNLQKRVRQYFAKNSLWKQEMLNKARKVDFLVVQNEGEALYLENNLIKKHTPFRRKKYTHRRVGACSAPGGASRSASHCAFYAQPAAGSLADFRPDARNRRSA